MQDEAKQLPAANAANRAVDEDMEPHPGGRRRYLWFVLLLPCYAAYLLPGIFARQTPEIAGVPFFYWWQFCWIIITALMTGVVYRMVVSRSTRP